MLRALRLAAVAAGFALAALSAWPAAATPDTFHDTIGGVGDRDGPPMVCPPSHPLFTGVFGRTGHWVDRIGILCTQLLPGYKTGETIRHEYRGGSGGGKTRDAKCRADAGIRNVKFWVGYDNGKAKVVRGISFNCYKPSNGRYTNSDEFGGQIWRDPPFDETKEHHQACTGSEYAVGLSNRWGSHVNAIGLICAKLKAPAPFILIPVPGQSQKPMSDEAGGSQPPKVTGLGKKPVSEALNEGMENDTDRPGSDIHRFELQDASPGVCQARCAKLDRCKAWTFVRPGVQGPKAVCYLKDGVPQAVPNTCCVSGAKPPSGTSPGAMQEPGGFATATARRCKPGFVWREARPADVVCVTPESRSMVSQENAVAPSRRDPSGAYGPNTCIAGFVWREAFDGDAVCVTPERRAAVKEENRVGPSRTE